MAVDVEKIIDQLDSMSVLDLVKLSQALQEKWGVSAAPVMAAGMMPAAGGAGAAEAAAPVEEQSEFDVMYMHIHCSRGDFARILPHLLQDLVARHQPVAVVHQVAQKL